MAADIAQHVPHARFAGPSHEVGARVARRCADVGKARFELHGAKRWHRHLGQAVRHRRRCLPAPASTSGELAQCVGQRGAPLAAGEVLAKQLGVQPAGQQQVAQLDEAEHEVGLACGCAASGGRQTPGRARPAARRPARRHRQWTHGCCASAPPTAPAIRSARERTPTSPSHAAPSARASSRSRWRSTTALPRAQQSVDAAAQAHPQAHARTGDVAPAVARSQAIENTMAITGAKDSGPARKAPGQRHQ